MLRNDVLESFQSWLTTLSPPSSMAKNSAALVQEQEILEKTLELAGVTSTEEMSRVFFEVKSHAKTRAWPTAMELRQAVSRARGEGRDVSGDRSKLSFEKRAILENEVLPTARRWLTIPGLKSQGERILAHWGEA